MCFLHKDLIMYILHGLGSNYHGFVIFLNTRQIEPNLFKLQSMLMMEEQLIVTQSKADKDHVLQANFAKNNTRNNFTRSSTNDKNSSSHRSK